MAALRFGVVGTGTWAQRVHVPAALASDRAPLVAVLGRDAARTAALVEGTPALAYTDAGSFLDAVDIVGFAVPPDVQSGLAATAIEAGKHLLLEKPVSMDAAVARTLAARAAERGIHSTVFFPHLLVPVFAEWAAGMRERDGWRLGRVESYSSVLADPANPFHDSPWRHEHGALWDVGPHAIAQLCAVLGPVTSVVGRRGPGDLVSLLLEHRAGAQGAVSMAADFPPPAPAGGGTYFIGVHGRAQQPSVPDWDAAARDAYLAAIAHLADQVEHGAPQHRSDLGFGAHVTAVLAAAEQSMSSGRAETV
ncbi:MAG: oxidoreductase protein [Rhodoglobus sp.]|nr:oxidoreductase protein [Rhodoglobus sp.]